MLIVVIVLYLPNLVKSLVLVLVKFLQNKQGCFILLSGCTKWPRSEYTITIGQGFLELHVYGLIGLCVNAATSFSFLVM